MSASPDGFNGRRLDSWKEIAAFLARGERTVKRWEAERGLPVHRLPGRGRSAVFAYSNELADWLRSSASDEPSSAERSANKRGEPQPLKIESESPIGLASSTDSQTASRITAWLLPLVLVASTIGLVGDPRPRLEPLVTRHVPNTEAQDLYLQGRYFWTRRTPDDLNKAVDYFTQAIVKDPNDAQAYVGLADCYNLLREFGAMPPTEAYPRALSAAQRAVELDGKSAEALTSLAFVTFWWSWQGASAEREFKRALELNPNLARAHHWYATYLFGRNRFSEALDQMEQAQKLDPSSTPILADKGFLLWRSGNHREGLALLTQLENAEPSFSGTHNYLAQVYWEQKNYAKALAEWKRGAELRHDESGLAIVDAGEKGFRARGLEGLYENELPLQKDLVDHGGGSAYALATTYAVLGKRREALAYLQLSFDRREQSMLTGDPITSLANDPEYERFRALVNRQLTQ